MHLYIPLYSLGRTLDGSVGALGEFWEVMYIKKLPINRPCSRYVMHKNHYFLFGDEVGYMIPCRSFICFHVLVPTSIFVRNIEIPQNSSLIKQNLFSPGQGHGIPATLLFCARGFGELQSAWCMPHHC